MLNFNPALEPLALSLQPREQAQRRNAWSGPHACDLRVDIVCKTIKINGIAAQLQELCRRLRFKPEIARFTLHVLEYRQAILDRPVAHIVNIVVEPAMIGRRLEAVDRKSTRLNSSH